VTVGTGGRCEEVDPGIEGHASEATRWGPIPTPQEQDGDDNQRQHSTDDHQSESQVTHLS
jgi:hypothetical protein